MTMRFTAIFVRETAIGSVTSTATIDMADDCDNVGARLGDLVQQVSASAGVSLKPVHMNGNVPPKPTASAAPHNGHEPKNGNGGQPGELDLITPKQRGFAISLASRLGLKGAAGVDKTAVELLGKRLSALTRAEGSQLIDHLRAQGEKAAS